MYPGWVLACGCLAAAPAPAVRPVPCHGISLPPFFQRYSPVDLPEVSDLYLAGALETSIAQTFETFACVFPNLLLALCP